MRICHLFLSRQLRLEGGLLSRKGLDLASEFLALGSECECAHDFALLLDQEGRVNRRVNRRLLLLVLVLARGAGLGELELVCFFNSDEVQAVLDILHRELHAGQLTKEGILQILFQGLELVLGVLAPLGDDVRLDEEVVPSRVHLVLRFGDMVGIVRLERIDEVVRAVVVEAETERADFALGVLEGIGHGLHREILQRPRLQRVRGDLCLQVLHVLLRLLKHQKALLHGREGLFLHGVACGIGHLFFGEDGVSPSKRIEF